MQNFATTQTKHWVTLMRQLMQSTVMTKKNQENEYDIQQDIKAKFNKTINNRPPKAFESTQHPQIMDNNYYYRLRRLLNREQQKIIKNIIIKKLKKLNTPIHLFLTGGAGTRKTFTATTIYQALIRLYSNSIDSDPNKPKGIMVAYTGKATYNISGTTLHSALHKPFNKSEFTPLNTETPDTMSKTYSELRVLLIDEISLVGSTFLRYINK